MWQPEFLWFFTLFYQEFRKNNPIAFEVLMVLAVAHLFGFYNPKQLADFLEVPHQNFGIFRQNAKVVDSLLSSTLRIAGMRRNERARERAPQ